MALNAMDSRAEELELLRRLAQSPAWAVYSSLVRQRMQRSNQARVTLQRQREHEAAYGEQRYLDGMDDAWHLVALRIAQLEGELGETPGPAYGT